MGLLTVLFNLPGSPVPDWLIFLTPFVVFIGLVKGGQLLSKWIFKKVLPHFFHKHTHDLSSDGEL